MEFGTFSTTGDRGHDEYLRRLENRIRALEQRGAGTTTTVVETQVQSSSPSVKTLNSLQGNVLVEGTRGILATESGQTITLEVDVEVLTADPVSPTDGRMWFRSDLLELRVRVAGTTRKVVFT